jgi:hypothetical protein
VYKICEECYDHDTGWANDQNKSYSSSEIIELCSWTILNLNYFCNEKYVWISSHLKIWIFQTTSNGETNQIKVVAIENLWNFVVYNFFIWNHIDYEKQSLNVSNLKFKFCKRAQMDKLQTWKLCVSKSCETL